MIEEKLYVLKENDPYKVLNISENADMAEITKVYRELAKEFHPDLHNHLKGVEKEELNLVFTKITTAFNTLKDPEARRKIDYERRQAAIRKNASVNTVTINKAPDKKAAKTDVPGSINFQDLFTDSKVDAKEIKKKKAEDLFNTAIINLNNGSLDDAVSNLQTAIELNPRIAKYHSHLALAMQKKGWNGYAMAEFKVALNFDPADPVALKNYVPSASVPKKAVKEENNSEPGLLNRVKNLFKKP